jgi:NAD(P)-dependent dehydrogenase (short-subunit alcohol dehydrogenase family)
VTGAGRGLGREIAIVLAEKGCKVVVVDINFAAVTETANEINSKGGTAVAMKCDVSNWDDIVDLRKQVELDIGPIDILVNNAALIVMESFMKNTQQDIERSMAVNVNGVVYVRKNVVFKKIFILYGLFFL